MWWRPAVWGLYHMWWPRWRERMKRMRRVLFFSPRMVIKNIACLTKKKWKYQWAEDIFACMIYLRTNNTHSKIFRANVAKRSTMVALLLLTKLNKMMWRKQKKKEKLPRWWLGGWTMWSLSSGFLGGTCTELSRGDIFLVCSADAEERENLGYFRFVSFLCHVMSINVICHRQISSLSLSLSAVSPSSTYIKRV